MAVCAHLSPAHVRPVKPLPPNGCAECLVIGQGWVHLRECLECGHVGCCDQSIGKHATQHYHATTHPIMRSYEPGEDWGYCYADHLMFEPAPRPVI